MIFKWANNKHFVFRFWFSKHTMAFFWDRLRDVISTNPLESQLILNHINPSLMALKPKWFTIKIPPSDIPVTLTSLPVFQWFVLGPGFAAPTCTPLWGHRPRVHSAVAKHWHSWAGCGSQHKPSCRGITLQGFLCHPVPRYQPLCHTRAVSRARGGNRLRGDGGGRGS